MSQAPQKHLIAEEHKLYLEIHWKINIFSRIAWNTLKKNLQPNTKSACKRLQLPSHMWLIKKLALVWQPRYPGMLLSTTWTSLSLWLYDADVSVIAPSFVSSVLKTNSNQSPPSIPPVLCGTAKTALKFQLKRFRIWVFCFWLKKTPFEHSARQLAAPFWHQIPRSKLYRTGPVCRCYDLPRGNFSFWYLTILITEPISRSCPVNTQALRRSLEFRTNRLQNLNPRKRTLHG